MPTQVTSRGASRAFVLHVLFRMLQYCQSYYEEKGEGVVFPINPLEISRWLDLAINDSCVMGESFFTCGGTKFNRNDTSTYCTCSMVCGHLI